MEFIIYFSKYEKNYSYSLLFLIQNLFYLQKVSQQVLYKIFPFKVCSLRKSDIDFNFKYVFYMLKFKYYSFYNVLFLQQKTSKCYLHKNVYILKHSFFGIHFNIYFFKAVS